MLVTIRCLVRVIFGVHVVARFLIDSISVWLLSVPCSLRGAVINSLNNLLMPLISESLLPLDVILHMLICLCAHAILDEDVLHHPRNERETCKESHYLC